MIRIIINAGKATNSDNVPQCIFKTVSYCVILIILCIPKLESEQLEAFTIKSHINDMKSHLSPVLSHLNPYKQQGRMKKIQDIKVKKMQEQGR